MPILTENQKQINQLQEELGKDITDFSLTQNQRDIVRLRSEINQLKKTPIADSSMGVSSEDSPADFSSVLSRPFEAIGEKISSGIEKFSGEDSTTFDKFVGATDILFSPITGPAQALGEGAEFLAGKAGASEKTASRVGSGVDLLANIAPIGGFGAFRAVGVFSRFMKKMPKTPRELKGMERDLFQLSKGKRTHLQRKDYNDIMEEILAEAKTVFPSARVSVEKTMEIGEELGMTPENMKKLLGRVPVSKLAAYLDAARVVSVKTLSDFKGILAKLPDDLASNASDETLAIASNAMFKVFAVHKTVSSFTSNIARALRQSGRTKKSVFDSWDEIGKMIKVCEK